MHSEIAVHGLLDSYPRARNALPERHAAIYERHYKENRSGGNAAASLAQRAEGWMHRKVASRQGGPVLELGAGTLNHLQYEAHSDAYDVVEPFALLYRESPEIGRVRNVFAAQDEIAGATYKRIISVAVLEHMPDLPREVALSSTLLEDDGVFQAGIPSEGGFLWWLGWRATTGVAYYLKHRLDYGILMRHEHVSTASEIISVVQTFFENVTIERFPLPARHLSLYTYIEARGPRRDAARNLLLKG